MTRKALEAFDPKTLKKNKGKGFEVRNKKTGFGEFHYFYRSADGDLFSVVCKNMNEAVKLRSQWVAAKIPTVKKDEMIKWLRGRLLSRNSKNQLTWSQKDAAAVSRLMIEVQRLELREKALIVIEHIAVHGDEDDVNMAGVYKAAHVANGECLAEHEDWKDWVEKVYADLVVRGEHNPIGTEEARQQMRETIKRLESIRPDKV